MKLTDEERFEIRNSSFLRKQKKKIKGEMIMSKFKNKDKLKDLMKGIGK